MTPQFGKHEPGELPEGIETAIEITDPLPLFAVKQLHPRTNFTRIRLEVLGNLLVYASNVWVITIEVPHPLPSMLAMAIILLFQSCLIVYSAYQAILLSTCSFILKRYMDRIKEDYIEQHQRSQGQL